MKEKIREIYGRLVFINGTLTISYFISGTVSLATFLHICYSVAIGSGLAAGNLLAHG